MVLNALVTTLHVIIINIYVVIDSLTTYDIMIKIDFILWIFSPWEKPLVEDHIDLGQTGAPFGALDVK